MMMYVPRDVDGDGDADDVAGLAWLKRGMVGSTEMDCGFIFVFVF